MKYQIYPNLKRPNKLSLFIVLSIALLTSVGYLLTYTSNQDLANTESLTIDSAKTVEGSYLFSGTVVWGRAVENEARTTLGIDYAHPFKNLISFGTYDAWAADIECPVTTKTIPYYIQVANTVFNCRPEFLKEMSKHINLANLANNHTMDQGQDGYEQSLKHLAENGLQTFSNYTPRATDDICEVVSLPVRINKPDNYEEKTALPVAFCAWHYFDFDTKPGEIDVMDRYAKIMPVFAFMHTGTEYQVQADEKQVRIAHEIADHNPEFIIGNSPHWVQNTEVYKGKLIVYSTGNFIFDQLDAETNRGLSVAVEMSLPYDDNVEKWTNLAGSCRVRKDSCLGLAEAQGLTKIKPSYTFGIVGSIGGYKQITTKADTAVQKALETRANWQQTLELLGQ